jgi:hypothetical protein
MKLLYMCIGVFAMQMSFAQTQEKKELKQFKTVEMKTVEKEPVHYKTENNAKENSNQNYPLNLSSKSKNDKNQVLEEPKPFEPIPATGNTDKYYQQNLEKSIATQKALDATPVSPPKEISKEQQIENYKLAQKKYETNSVEYNQIQEKINILNNEN